MKKRFGLLLGLVLVLAGILPASAQSSIDPQLQGVLQTAFTNMLFETSMTLTTNSSTETADAQAAGTPARQSSGKFQLAATATDWNISGSETTTINGAFGGAGDASATAEPATISLDFVMVDGKSYVRFTSVPEAMQQNLSSDWTEVGQGQGGQNGQNGRGGFAGAFTSSQQITAALYLPLDATSVTALTEAPADTIDGQAMRVFQISFDPQALANTQAAPLVRGVGGFSGGRGTGGGQNAPAGNGNDGAQATRPAGGGFQFAPMNTEITATVWVGSDQLIHRIETVVTRTPSDANGTGPGAAASTTTTTTDFSDFNQPVTITAPAVPVSS